MKKNVFTIILFFVCIMCLQSCISLTKTTLIGDITTYTQDGKAIKTWKDVTIQEQVENTNTQSAFKMWGLNFYDKETDQFIIISNTIPYIIEYKSQKETIETNTDAPKAEGRKYPEFGARN